MRRGRISYLIHCGDNGIEGGIVANGQICTIEVIVNCARQANDGDVILLCELPCSR